jgi:hypothetical protein
LHRLVGLIVDGIERAFSDRNIRIGDKFAQSLLLNLAEVFEDDAARAVGGDSALLSSA